MYMVYQKVFKNIHHIIWHEKEGALSIEFLLDIYTINQTDSHVDTIRSNLVDESRKNDEIQSTRLSVCLIHNCGSTKATNGAVPSSLFPECFTEIMVRVPELTRLQLPKASISVYPKSGKMALNLLKKRPPKIKAPSFLLWVLDQNAMPRSTWIACSQSWTWLLGHCN